MTFEEYAAAVQPCEAHHCFGDDFTPRDQLGRWYPGNFFITAEDEPWRRVSYGKWMLFTDNDEFSRDSIDELVHIAYHIYTHGNFWEEAA